MNIITQSVWLQEHNLNIATKRVLALSLLVTIAKNTRNMLNISHSSFVTIANGFYGDPDRNRHSAATRVVRRTEQPLLISSALNLLIERWLGRAQSIKGDFICGPYGPQGFKLNSLSFLSRRHHHYCRCRRASNNIIYATVTWPLGAFWVVGMEWQGRKYACVTIAEVSCQICAHWIFQSTMTPDSG